MKPQPIENFDIGKLVFTLDRYDGEDRETYYIRTGDVDVKYKGNLRIARFGFIQGQPNNPDARLKINLLDKPCTDPGEMHRLTPCYSVKESSFFLPLKVYLTAMKIPDEDNPFI